MYLREVHSTHFLPTLYSFVKTNPLGALTSFLRFGDHAPLQSSHIPFVLDIPDDLVSHGDLKDLPNETSEAYDARLRESKKEPLGTLRAHLARANPQAKALIAAAKAQASAERAANSIETDKGEETGDVPEGGIELPEEVLVIFTGPIQHYVTPKFYTATKPTTGKVVPTWNYEAVQVYGRVTVYPSTTSEAATRFLSTAISDLSHNAETAMGYTGTDGKASAWLVDDAPDRYIDLLKKSIVGISIEIRSIGGKFKMSQELGTADRQGVVDGFAALGLEPMAGSVQRHGSTKQRS